MSDYKGIAYLKKRLKAKSSRVNLRYEYYEMKQLARILVCQRRMS